MDCPVAEQFRRADVAATIAGAAVLSLSSATKVLVATVSAETNKHFHSSFFSISAFIFSAPAGNQQTSHQVWI
jgi:hypothetical protein